MTKPGVKVLPPPAITTENFLSYINQLLLTKDIVSSHGAFQAPRPPVSLLTLLLWHRFQMCKAFAEVKNHISDCEKYFARAKNISESCLD